MRLSSKRLIEKYDAFKDAAHRWPDWRLVVRKIDIRIGETMPEKVVMRRAKRIVINEECPNIPLVAAQAVAHLDLGHHEATGWLTEEQRKSALWLGKMRVDDDEGWPAIDGEPSQPMDGVNVA